MQQKTAKLYQWALQKASSQLAPLWLGLLFALEIVLFVPLDAILMFFCLQKRSNIFLYVLIATVASTLSGLLGYVLGHFLWDMVNHWVIPHVVSAATFERFTAHFQMYENWALFFGGLLPFPLKVLSLVAGVFQLGMVPFITYFAVARLIRFSLVGGAMALWGEKVKGFVDRHFHRIFMLIGAKVAGTLLFFWILAR